MAVNKTASSAKRFGTRYGRTLRNKLGSIESQHRGKKVCPFCTWKKLKRTAAGIWECGKCNKKFAAKAYSPNIQK